MTIANTTLIIKKSGVSGNTPSTLKYGELGINYADGKLYYKNANGAIVAFTAGVTSNSFATINANSSLILASSNNDTLSLVPGNNVTFTTNTATKTIVINSAVPNFSGVSNYFQNTAPTTAISHDFWTNSDTGVEYENFGTPSSPVWVETGPTGVIANSQPGAITATTFNANTIQANTSVNTSTLIVTSTAALNSTVVLGKQIYSTYNGSNGGATLMLSGSGTQGGAGYFDFIKANNTTGSGESISFRVDSSGNLQLINNNYTSTIFAVSQNGLIQTGTATATNQIPANNALSLNNHSYVFDDGNMHLTANSGSIWINSNDGGDVRINTQSPATGGMQVGGTFQMNSGYGSVAPVYGVRAWISCGYVGGNMVTNGSGNLSVTRLGVGVYQFTFTNNMPDSNYCINANAKVPNVNSDIAVNVQYNTNPTTSSFVISTARYGSGQEDVPQLFVSVIR